MPIMPSRTLAAAISCALVLLQAHARASSDCAGTSTGCRSAAWPRDRAGDPSRLGPQRARAGELRSEASCRAAFAAARASLARVAPAIDVSPQSPDYRLVDLGGTHLSYTTPAFVSMDQPRAVTLVYSSSIAAPRGFVQVDATDNSTEAPVKMSLRVKDANGAWVTPETFYQSGSGTSRLAAAWQAGNATGAQAYTAVVRSYWSDGTYLESSAAVRVPIVTNQLNQMYGRLGVGWFIAGQQRIRAQSDGVMWLTEGDGTMKAFGPPDASGAYHGPPGDFTLIRPMNGGGYARQYPDSSKVIFSGWGEMIAQRDRFGNQTTWNYDAGWLLQSIVDPAGKAITFGYTGGMLTSITDPGGRVTGLAYTGGDLTQVTAPDNVADLGVYYENHHARRWWNRASATTTAYYDYNDRLGTVFDPQVTLADGSTVYPKHTMTPWETAVLPQQNTGTAANPSPRVLPANAETAVTDPNGYTTWMALTGAGQPSRIRDALGRTSYTSWNASLQPTRTLSYDGHAVTYTWSGMDLVRVWDEATGETVNVDYEPVYHLPIHVYGNTQETRSYYSVAGALDSTRAVGLPVTKYTHDSRGRVKAITDAEGHGTFYTYGDEDGSNPWGNLRSQALGAVATSFRRVSSVSYDLFGRPIAGTNPAGQVDSTYYNVLNQVVRTVNANREAVAYTYTSGRLTQVTDPKGQTYGFGYNALGWKTSETDPRGQAITYAYDAAGNVAAATNRRGQTLRSTYDALHRLLTRTDVTTGAVTAFSYDPQGLWMAGSNAESTDTLRFDVAGRTVGQISLRGGVRYALASSFNGNGQRAALTMSAPWARSIGYRYNSRMQLDTLIDLAGGRTALEYDDDQILTATHLPNGFNITNGITSTHAAAQYSFDGPLLFHRLDTGFSLDSLGRRAIRWNAAGDSSRNYGYDRAGRLSAWQDWFVSSETCTGTVWSADNGPGACDPMPYRELQNGESYIYDAAGNRTDQSAIVDTGNRLTRFGPYAMQFDPDGSMTSKIGNGKTQSLTWNAEGELTSITTNGATTTYGYDAFGRRVRKTTPSGTSKYLYDGDNLFMELDGSGNPVREYTYYPGVDNPHSVRQGGQMYYYLTESLGSVIGMVNSAGQVVNEYKYGPWGGLQVSRETVPNPLKFAAREYDVESGLYYERARYYDLETNRFISEDPIGLEGGLNPYVYAGNDPVNFNDPSGLCEQMALVEITWYSDGSIDWEILGYYWAGDDCEKRTGGGGGPTKNDRRLKKSEDSRLKCVADHYMSQNTRSVFLRQLQLGNVYVGKRTVDGFGFMDPYVDPMRIVFRSGANGGVIGMGELALAQILAHEVGHLIDASKIGQDVFANRYASEAAFHDWAEQSAREYSASHVHTEPGGSPLCPGVEP
jgi:RHS repeat-associated protein